MLSLFHVSLHCEKLDKSNVKVKAIEYQHKKLHPYTWECTYLRK